MKDDFDELTKDLLSLASEFNGGRESKKFLRKEGSKLRKIEKKKAQQTGIKKHTGNFYKKFKRGRIYKDKNGDLSIRAYNSSPHAHLLNNGHIIKDKNGVEHGFTKGTFFMEKAKEDFQNSYRYDIEDFVDDMLDNHGL